MTDRFDLAIVGSGFGGSLLAAIACRLGWRVVLLEKGTHPRFAIGESTSPLANILLESLAVRHDLPDVAALARWGSWRRRHPEVAGGIKRGFSFYHHAPGKPLADRAAQLLVGASPHEDVADTHWFREDVDAFLVAQARSVGTAYVDRIALEAPEFEHGRVRLRGARDGRFHDFDVRLLVDASGPRGFLHRALALPESSFSRIPATHALYSHFRGVGRVEDLGVNGSEVPPYPVDDAALHHVFAGGWIWVLRFGNGITSAGAALSPELAAEIRAEEGEPAWRRLLARLPAVARQFSGSVAIRPFVHAAPLPFRAARACGPGWTMLPSAAAFVDPLLSTGFPLTLLGIERLADAFATFGSGAGLDARLEAIARETLAEADRTACLVGALWRAFDDFETFSALTMFYFAAASFAEASRRLGRGEAGRSFLGGDDPAFRAALERTCGEVGTRARRDDSIADGIRTAIASRNVAGLLDPSRRNWYPADPDDLRASAARLGATPREVEEMLVASGLRPPGADGGDGARPVSPKDFPVHVGPLSAQTPSGRGGLRPVAPTRSDGTIASTKSPADDRRQRGSMANRTRCPNPKGCDGELYARANGVPGEWCPKCGYVFSGGAASAAGVTRCPNPKGCDGELYARADGVAGQWCPTCGFVFSGRSATPAG